MKILFPNGVEYRFTPLTKDEFNGVRKSPGESNFARFKRLSSILKAPLIRAGHTRDGADEALASIRLDDMSFVMHYINRLTR